IDEIASALVALHGADAPLRIVDLGAGTGALTASLAARLPRATFLLLDADAAMLRRAQDRLAPFASRIDTKHGSFGDPIPTCDVAVASLSLHHVHELAKKEEVYRNVRASSKMLLSADVTMPRNASLADRARARWAAHLVAHGDTEAQAYG